MPIDKIFFQSSMPRAFSTLFQNVLGQNPDFHVTPTDGSLELLFGARSNYTNSPEFKAQDAEIMRKAFAAFCKSGLQGYCDSLVNGTSKKYIMLKSRGWGVYRPFVETFYDNPKIICLVRNLKDVVTSYEKMYRRNQDKHDPIRNDIQATGTHLYKRVDDWMNPKNTIGMAVERIQEIISLGYDSKILFIRAEDFSAYPETSMKIVYDYLELPYFEHDFDNITQITVEDDQVYGLVKDLHKIRPKLEVTHSDASKVLDNHVRNYLYERFRWYYDKFRYEK